MTGDGSIELEFIGVLCQLGIIAGKHEGILVNRLTFVIPPPPAGT